MDETEQRLTVAIANSFRWNSLVDIRKIKENVPLSSQEASYLFDMLLDLKIIHIFRDRNDNHMIEAVDMDVMAWIISHHPEQTFDRLMSPLYKSHITVREAINRAFRVMSDEVFMSYIQTQSNIDKLFLISCVTGIERLLQTGYKVTRENIKTTVLCHVTNLDVIKVMIKHSVRFIYVLLDLLEYLLRPPQTFPRFQISYYEQEDIAIMLERASYLINAQRWTYQEITDVIEGIETDDVIRRRRDNPHYTKARQIYDTVMEELIAKQVEIQVANQIRSLRAGNPIDTIASFLNFGKKRRSNNMKKKSKRHMKKKSKRHMKKKSKSRKTRK